MKKRKKIVFLLWNLRGTFGCNRMAIEYAKRLNQNKYSVEIFSFLGGEIKKEVKKLNLHSFLILLLRQKPIDVLIFTGYWPVAFLSLLVRARRKIYFIQGLDSLREKNLILKKFAELSYRLPFEKITISKFLKNKVEKYSPKPVWIVCYPLNPIYFSKIDLARDKSLIPKERNKKNYRVLSVLSNYSFIKGPDLLTEVVKKLKERNKKLQFTLVSFEKKPYSNIFDKFISNPSLERLYGEYLKADIFLSTSRREGFFLPALEAMASGCLVVMTDSGGIREYARDKFNCLLVKTPKEIVEKNLIETILDNHSLRKKLILNGLVTAKKFTWEKAMYQLEKFLNKKPNDAKIKKMIFWFFLFFLGLFFGSFINCVVYRLNNGLSPLKGRSICPKCKHQLAWFDNIPLLSFILLGGKCRYCGKPISWQYPLVELASGALTLSIFNFQFFPSIAGSRCGGTIFNLIITYSLLAIFVSDLVYTTIPDELVYPTLLIVFIYLLIFRPLNFLISNFLISFSTAGFFYLLVLITRGRGMGLGDVKLAGLMGLILGWPKIIIALYLAFLTGAFFGVILILLKKKKFGQHIPFGPFLATATFISIFWGEKIWLWGERILGLQ